MMKTFAKEVESRIVLDVGLYQRHVLFDSTLFYTTSGLPKSTNLHGDVKDKVAHVTAIQPPCDIHCYCSRHLHRPPIPIAR